MTETTKARVLDVGVRGYQETYDLQLEILEQRKDGHGQDTLIVVEHPHVITLGRKKSAEANVVSAGDVEVVQIERGGDVTYHGPGQLVMYPIVALQEGERDLHRFLRNLEEAMIKTLAALGIEAGREEGKTGVWKDHKKLASIGIACRRWVTFHGIALNVTTDLSYFHRINPCGFESGIMTKVEDVLANDGVFASDQDLMDVVKKQLIADMSTELARDFRPN